MQNAAQADLPGAPPERGDATASGRALASVLTVPDLARLAGEHALGSGEYSLEELTVAAAAMKHGAEGVHAQLLRLAIQRGNGQ